MEHVESLTDYEKLKKAEMAVVFCPVCKLYTSDIYHLLLYTVCKLQ